MTDRAARRTLGRWLLTAFLERGCDPTTERVPTPVPRVRPLTAAELAALAAARRAEVVFLPHRRAAADAAGSGAEEPENGSAKGVVLQFPPVRARLGAGLC